MKSDFLGSGIIGKILSIITAFVTFVLTHESAIRTSAPFEK